MSGKKRKSKPIVQKGIPSGPSETVTTREYTRSATSRLMATTSVSSSRSSTPLPPKTADEPCDHLTETELYSDVDEEVLGKEAKKKRKQSSRSVNVSACLLTSLCLNLSNNYQTLLLEFLGLYEDEFADEWVRLESSPQLACLPECIICKTPDAVYRCTDCFAESLFCKKCLSFVHCREPFHRLEVAHV